MSADGQTTGATAVAFDGHPVLDVVEDKKRVLELTAILRDVVHGLRELSEALEGGRMLPIEAAAWVVLLEQRATTSPDGTSYVGRPV